MRVCISGTPGTGKTTVSSLLGMNVINLNDFAKKNNCIRGYDRKRRSRIVDIDCVKNKMKDMDNVVIEGHFSHLLWCDVVIILRTSPKILKKRLEDKKFDKDKIRENLEAEALGVITEEAMEENKNVYEIDTSFSSPEDVAKKIREILNGEGEEYRAGKIDYMEEILEWY